MTGPYLAPSGVDVPIDMHGKLAVRTGEITIAVGRPIRKAKHV